MNDLGFKVGFEPFNENWHFNIRINTWYATGCLSYEDAKKAGASIQSVGDWKREFVKLAQSAEAEDRLLNAAFCYRIAEFNTPHTDPDKAAFYERYRELYGRAIQGSGIETFAVPYDGGFLPAMRFAAGGPSKGTLVIHGGYDSDMEDFHNIYRFVSAKGYEVIAFEGPGQGAANSRYHLRLTHEWEKPTSAVLDYFGLDGVTLLGVSLGGYLALRAAAYEPRIRRVVLCDIVWDLLAAILTSLYSAAFWESVFDMLRRESRAEVDALERELLVEKKDVFMTWFYRHGQFILGVSSLYDFLREMRKYHARGISALVSQDVLLLAGQDDFYTMFYEEQKNALIHARSVEGRIFTREEHASNHCQVGNMPLLLDYVLDWMERKA